MAASRFVEIQNAVKEHLFARLEQAVADAVDFDVESKEDFGSACTLTHRVTDLARELREWSYPLKDPSKLAR